MPDFASQIIQSWNEFNDSLPDMTSTRPSEARPWVYRGQQDDYPLTTTIERALMRWDISLAHARSIEFQTIREFRRRLREPEYHRAQDALYCLSVMQHYGAPTRLLDCTYSPFVAAAFAMESGIFGPNGKRLQPTIWCFRGQWCDDEAKRSLPPGLGHIVARRNSDAKRNDQTFIPLYQIKLGRMTASPTWKFVKSENPLLLNERLTAQQGAFLCPPDLGSSFVDNLKAMDGWNCESNVRKLCLKLDPDEAMRFARNLKNMNISFAALFPGLDGFAKSINQQIGHYHELGQGQAGVG
jgi:hypothetical protein